MNITIMIDVPDSFLHKYAPAFIDKLRNSGHDVTFITDEKNIINGDLLFLLGCGTILSDEKLKYNEHNLVVHPSKLPEGRGSAALVWKILEGENRLFITLFEASTKLDRGDIYLQDYILLEGHELSDEIRYIQALKIFELVLKFIENYQFIKSKKQIGKGSFYPKRTSKDSELDINKYDWIFNNRDALERFIETGEQPDEQPAE